jgi:hypothetical protein
MKSHQRFVASSARDYSEGICKTMTGCEVAANRLGSAGSHAELHALSGSPRKLARISYTHMGGIGLIPIHKAFFGNSVDLVSTRDGNGQREASVLHLPFRWLFLPVSSVTASENREVNLSNQSQSKNGKFDPGLSILGPKRPVPSCFLCPNVPATVPNGENSTRSPQTSQSGYYEIAQTKPMRT